MRDYFPFYNLFGSIGSFFYPESCPWEYSDGCTWHNGMAYLSKRKVNNGESGIYYVHAVGAMEVNFCILS